MDTIENIIRLILGLILVIGLISLNAIVIQFILNKLMSIGVNFKFAIGVALLLLMVKGTND